MRQFLPNTHATRRCIMKVSQAVDFHLQYHRANSQKKHPQDVRIRTHPFLSPLWQAGSGQYLKKYRITPHTLYRNRLFLNKRGKEVTRHGIYRLCRKYQEKVLPSKRLRDLNPAHSFRHSCEVNMLLAGHPISDIKNLRLHTVTAQSR